MACEPWPIQWPCVKGSSTPGPPEDVDPTVVAMAVTAAQDVLYALTGYRLGSCTSIEQFRPKGGGQCDPWAGSGRMLLALANVPVQRIEAVRVNGVALPSGSYRAGAGGLVELLSGSWPSTGGVPPVEVEYVWGVRLAVETVLTPTGSLAALAMGEMAGELCAGLCGGKCALPSRLSSLTRQGVTIDFMDPAEFVAEGLTGLPLSDALIRAVNPGRFRARSRVYSPGLATRV